ncbi:MAG: FAD-dependent oxidoreductase [Betaproteobacteria bacterium]|nr:FAD-dependent oxidoreductase [Betaproteobacteria bacterium]
MKIAVIGSGIAGLSAAWLLARHSAQAHQVTLFEKDSRLGGHTHTIDVTVDGLTHAVDTGFLVYNDWTYPNLIALFEQLNIETAASDMSFSIKLMDDAGRGRLEWCGSDELSTVWAQPSNFVKPAFAGMLLDLLRFNRQAQQLTSGDASALTGTLGEFLDRNRYGRGFREWYLKPMAACIWSTPLDRVTGFPLEKFLVFCKNHGLISVNDRPKWRTVKGGARHYVNAIAGQLPDVRLNAAVTRVAALEHGLEITTAQGAERFDHAILACHTDQAARILDGGFAAQCEALSAIAYQANTAIVHTDRRLLPDRPRAWGAWNYLGWHSSASAARQTALRSAPVSLSYLINKLQPLPFKSPVIVTMNPLIDPKPGTVLKTVEYDHPLFLKQSVDAQRAIRRVQGQGNVWFAGAWTRYGFHEDGVMSGVAVARALGAHIPWQTQTPAANDLTTPYPGVDAEAGK